MSVPPRVLTVTPNPALDLTVQAGGWQRGEVNAAQAAQQDAGGKGVNVAALLADWGVSVAATGLLGRDNAAPFETLFREKGVIDEFVRVPGAARVGLKIVDRTRGDTTDLNLPGLTVSARALADLQATLRAPPPGVNVVALCGSLPPGVPTTFYAEEVARLRGQGRFVALDTSGQALHAALHAAVLPQLVKPNIHELEAALGRSLTTEAEVLAAARDLIRRGAELVTVSQGERGALLVTAHEALFARPPRVTVQSTVGAGDAMVAGLISAHLDGLGLQSAARRATAFSAGSITRLGAHLPPHAELDALAAQVQVESADALTH
ncbi:1-phosphofructokinase [Deinococcus hopiensis]|uniref:1-phosphofructokinase n=1 Tax=Deinococcus hopiensis KR-140 TaxID=695939 RepID=A0A1W1UY54_9DEIO|nr:1-phosphofructokinase [Deinococcus hopiensis]SMB85999.1 fructose-1-phosphate kinase [Deinococcus hopiensis KR-140]